MTFSDFKCPSTASLLEASLRILAHRSDPSPSEWCEKYGANVENSKFSMRRYCWCEEDSCPWCGPENRPNFVHKPSGLKIWWYKYIGRSMIFSKEPTPEEAVEILGECLGALPPSSAPE